LYSSLILFGPIIALSDIQIIISYTFSIFIGKLEETNDTYFFNVKIKRVMTYELKHMIYSIVTKIYESSLIINSKLQVIVKNVINGIDGKVMSILLDLLIRMKSVKFAECVNYKTKRTAKYLEEKKKKKESTVCIEKERHLHLHDNR